jgi:hypothetical protein
MAIVRFVPLCLLVYSCACQKKTSVTTSFGSSIVASEGVIGATFGLKLATVPRISRMIEHSSEV